MKQIKWKKKIQENRTNGVEKAPHWKSVFKKNKINKIKIETKLY